MHIIQFSIGVIVLIQTWQLRLFDINESRCRLYIRDISVSARDETSCAMLERTFALSIKRTRLSPLRLSPTLVMSITFSPSASVMNRSGIECDARRILNAGAPISATIQVQRVVDVNDDKPRARS
jgi:hypothetical protein